MHLKKENVLAPSITILLKKKHNILVILSLLKFCQSYQSHESFINLINFYQSHEFFISLMNLLSIFYVLINLMKTKPRSYHFHEVFTNPMKTNQNIINLLCPYENKPRY